MTTSDRPAWHFSTSNLPEDERTAAWVDAMRRLRLPRVTPCGPRPIRGEVTVAVSPMGLQFARIAADPQEIAGQSEDQIEGIWVSILIEGSAIIRAPGLEVPFAPGQILCGITRSPATLTLDRYHRQLFICIPRFVIAPRLLADLTSPIMLVDASAGMTAVFRHMMEAIAAELDSLTVEQLGPVEHSVVEFLVATLAAAGGIVGRGGAEGARAAFLHRILQRMETVLGDPELSMATLAEDAGISRRYLRRLFASQDMNFAATLKTRRLARCHADLVSPLYAQLGISEIAFRWGFNDAAHFSRSFREQFGLSPRDHRSKIAANAGVFGLGGADQ
jgi:AraC-like DNA-binding protein